MFRRVPQALLVRRAAAAAPTQQVRSYFYAGGGECGIWAATMKAVVKNLTWATAISVVILFKLVFVNHSTHNQFVSETSDLWESDGTELEGEEAVANLKIYRDRIMPFVEALDEKINSV